MAQSFEIREMRDEDIKAVAVLEKQIFPDPWSELSFRDMTGDAGWFGLVAVADHQIIGYACFMILLEEVHIANIAVVDSWRRKSVAVSLLQRILSVSRAHGCVSMFLEVRPSNAAALAFYERQGFTVIQRRKNYYQIPPEDALVMSRLVEPIERTV